MENTTTTTEEPRPAPINGVASQDWKPEMVSATPTRSGEITVTVGGRRRTFRWPSHEFNGPPPAKGVPLFGVWDPIVDDELLCFSASTPLDQPDAYAFLGVASAAD